MDQFIEKKGLIIKPNKSNSWSKSHCMLPTALKINDNKYRIFYGTRNKNNQSIITYDEIFFKKDKQLIKKSNKIVLNMGDLGNFDDNGVLPSSIIKINNIYYLYYIGWQPRVTTRYSLIAGLAFSKDGKKFKRLTNSPILFNNKKESISILTAPFVLKSKKNFMMWYVSGIKWNKKDEPLYDIKFATSKNGIKWKQHQKSCLKLKKGERALARPYVLKYKNKFKMWYSYEKKIGSYKIGYAESFNGVNWKRLDHKIKFNFKSKYEEKMREYPCLISNNKKLFILYNGDNYGKEGILLGKFK